jgi:eukaryotic-like serine/threonine-protein kinase
VNEPSLGPYRPGDIIAGKYELLRVISHGGMGWIWVAHHLALQVETAIKLIRPDLCTETATERFINEARVAAHVEHPGIVSIFDLGVTERGDPFIVMELLKGEDLRELLRRTGSISPISAVQLMLPVADALSTAHARGIVHRDLKPENVFIVRLEQRIFPKIVDFGIAKPSWPCDRRLTRSGTVMGSPEYMSPEQALGIEDVDQRIDVWSFCIVLYECLVGRPPFFGNYEGTLNDILQNPIVPITELGVREPELWTILERGLAKEREQRFQNMRELGRALAEWLLERGVDDDVCAQSLRATWLRAPRSGGRDIHRSGTPADCAPSVACVRLCDAVTLKTGRATPAAWGANAGPCTAERAAQRARRRPASAWGLALGILLFGGGCAGGSMWLDSALALPLPPVISSTLVAPVRALCAKVSFPRDRKAPAQTDSAESGAPPRRHLARNAVSRMAGQAPRRARPPAERLFGF